MATPRDSQPTAPTRELAAIMLSDIAGYTAIMGRDEERAIRALAEHRILERRVGTPPPREPSSVMQCLWSTVRHVGEVRVRRAQVSGESV
jgi:hypothetical protein